MASISVLGIGSGMDLNGLLDQLKAAERQKLQPIVQQKQVNQAKISAYGKIESALSSFQDAVKKLNDPASYRGVQSSVAGSSVTAAAGSNAPTGNFSVNVNSRAEAYSIASEGNADKTSQLGGGMVSFSFGNGETLDIEIDPTRSSLEQIRDAINNANGGVQASIVNDGSAEPHRLVFSSTTTGTDAGLASIDFSGDLAASMPALDTTTENQAKNASLSVNGIAITSQTNRVEDAIQGVTIDLQEVGSSTVTVSRDTELTETAITDFVKTYNNLQSTMAELTRFGGEGGVSGQLLGDSALRSIQQRLRNTMAEGVGDGAMRMLRDVGIDLEIDGKLKLDETKLSELTASRMTDLQTFFAGTSTASGLSGSLNSQLEQMLRSDGALLNSKQGLEANNKRLDDRFTRMEESIERTVDRYRTQFSQLDSMVARMNSTSTYLMQQFDLMNAQMGRK